MAQANRVYVKTATKGQGTVTLGTAVSRAFCTPAEAGVADGASIESYIIEAGQDFEIGVGIYNSTGPTLTRDTVRLSKIDGVVGTSKMNLLGNATVRVIVAAEDIANLVTDAELTAALAPKANIAVPDAHPSNQTSYTIKAADFGKSLIATNNAAAMMWTLPPNVGGFAAGGPLTVTNAGTQPLFIDAAVGSKFNVFDSATSIGYTRLDVSQNQTVTISSDGAGNWLFNTSHAVYSNGYEKSIHFTSYSLSTLGPFFYINGTPTIGDVIGFDYSYDLTPGPGRNTMSFRYTFLTNTVAELETAARSLESQIKFNATLNSILGPDNAQYFVAVQTKPLPNPEWLVAMNQVWPFNPTKNPTSAVFNSTGHTATIRSNTGVGGAAGTNLDIGSWIGLGRATRYAGREPAAGDRIAGIFIGGETVGNSFDNHNFQPIYGSFQWTITDPTPGAARAHLTATAGSYNFVANGAWGIGNFGITGSFSASDGASFGTNAPSSAVFVDINKNASNVANTPVTTSVARIMAADGVNTNLLMSNAGALGNTIAGTIAGGTIASPTATASGRVMHNLIGYAYGTTAYHLSGAFQMITDETQSDSAWGTKFAWFVTGKGSNALTLGMTLQASGGLSIGASAPDPGAGGGAFSSSVSMASGLINGNTAAPVAASVNSYLRVVGGDGVLVGTTIDGYGGASGGVIYDARVAGGTQAVKTAVTGGTVLFGQRALAWDGSAYGQIANIRYVAVGDQTPSNHGGSLVLRATPSGTTTIADAVTVQSSGGFSVGTATDPGIGNLNVKNAVQFGSFTVATLPTGLTGQQVYCSNCRMFNGAGVQESAAAGTGGMVSYNGTAWKIVGTNVTAVA